MKINQVFLDRMKDILGEEYEDFCNSLKEPIQKSIYVNENKISVNEFKKIVDFDIEKIPYDEAGFYVDNTKKGRHPLHHAGAFYLQEPSAMFTINSYKFNGDERVLDLCAAPGGKTIQIANRIPKGVLVSNEYVKERSEILFSNIERMGLRNVIVTNETPDRLSEAYGDSFDVILVDAPCSGEGMFRRGDNVTSEWYPEINSMCADRQIEILESANKMLKQGGVLIYSTCTYSKTENEDVVKLFMEKHGYQLINIESNMPRGIDMPEAVRMYPHKVRGEGQFVAVMKKNEENFYPCSTQLKLTNSRITNEFMLNNFVTKGDFVEYMNYSYFTPCRELIKKRINYISIGVRLGKVVSNRFEPHHNLFTAFGGDSKLKLCYDFKDKNVEKYLRGETFDVDLNDGFGTIFVNNCALGGFKISKGKFKNFYPKGLRNF